MPAHPPPGVHSSASVTISWNTRATSARATPDAGSLAHATVLGVNGNRVAVRLSDGTVRRYIATAGEAAALRSLIGHTIAFRLDPQ